MNEDGVAGGEVEFLHSVTRLKPRVGNYQEALRAYRSADLSVCFSELHGRLDPASCLLRARALARSDLPRNAFAELLQFAPELGHHAHVGERLLLSGAALTRLGKLEAAEPSLTDARVHAIAAACTPMVAEAEYYLALLRYVHGDAEQARTLCESVLELRALPYERNAYEIPLAHTRARAFELLGALEMLKGRYDLQLAATHNALSELGREPIGDSWIETQNLVNLAARARELDDDRSIAVAVARVDGIQWNDDLRARHWDILNSLGWSMALRGNHIGAFRYFRRAVAAATNDAERIISTAYRASLAFDLDQRLVGLEELEHAMEMARDVDWDACNGDRRTALLDLAETLAPIDVCAAREWLNTYRKSRSRADILSFAAVDPFVTSHERFTEGCVARYEGRTDVAIASMTDAFTRWNEAGFAWRAGRAAIELAELGAGELYVASARREAARRPLSWFARRASALEACTAGAAIGRV